MNFSSQICTTREQSERLLALGLKKETADMTIHIKNDGGCYVTAEPFYEWEDYDGDERALVSFCGNGFFAAVVDAIEWLIKQVRFNKEYLV